MLDNMASIRVTEQGASWRTRYFEVRGHRIREEIAKGTVKVHHEGTTRMLADGLTKLPKADVMETLRQAMHGVLPPAATTALKKK